MTKHTSLDRDGNELIQEGKNIFLRLSSETRRRRLGWFDPNTKTFHTERREAHSFRSTHSFGFNYHLMNAGKIKRVVVHLEGGEQVEAPASAILESGKVLCFSGVGQELQVFAPIEIFTKVEGTRSAI